MTERLAATTVGDGMASDTVMGPMANARRPDAIEGMEADARRSGARLDTGGEWIGNQGFFFQPTVMSEVPLDADAMNDEPFGPLALINPYRTVDEMIAEANRLPCGLARYARTSDPQRQRRVADALECGIMGINTAAINSVDARFGGVKWSGNGSENGPEGIQACMVTRVVHKG